MPSSYDRDASLCRLPSHDGAVISAKVVLPAGPRRGNNNTTRIGPASLSVRVISDKDPVTIVYKSALRRFTDKICISFPNMVSFGRATAEEVDVYCIWDSGDTYFGVSITIREHEGIVIAEQYLERN